MFRFAFSVPCSTFMGGLRASSSVNIARPCSSLELEGSEISLNMSARFCDILSYAGFHYCLFKLKLILKHNLMVSLRFFNSKRASFDF